MAAREWPGKQNGRPGLSKSANSSKKFLYKIWATQHSTFFPLCLFTQHYWRVKCLYRTARRLLSRDPPAWWGTPRQGPAAMQRSQRTKRANNARFRTEATVVFNYRRLMADLPLWPRHSERTKHGQAWTVQIPLQPETGQRWVLYTKGSCTYSNIVEFLYQMRT